MTCEIKHAAKEVARATEALNQAYCEGYKEGVCSSHESYRNYREVAKEVIALESKLKSLKEVAIKSAIKSGEKTKNIADSYGITPARVSQIAPRTKGGGD